MTLLSQIVATSEAIAGTASRRAKAKTIAECLRALAPDEIEIAVPYLAGETRQGRTGIGWATLRDARSPGAMTASSLTLHDVDGVLETFARTSGTGSARKRSELLRTLLARATREEQDFLVRLLIGELRQGALEGLMVEGLATAASLPVAQVRRAAMLAGGVARVASSALTEGAAGLARFAVLMFQPLSPMLAQPADDIEAAMAALGTAALEWKMDGARVQVHKQGNEVRLYTRSLNEVTAAAPEIVEAVRGLHPHELILDGEAIALNAQGCPQPFQVTMRRFGRTIGIEQERASLPLSAFFFDCLRRDGQDLVAEPAHTRFAALSNALPSALLMPRLVTGDAMAARSFYDDAIARGHEGVMVKSLQGEYDPGARSALWLKVKRAHTLDLVVLAAEWGHGRRHGWLSNLHLGAWDPDTGSYVMLGKTFKGMTDAMLEWQTRELLAREVRRDEWTVHVRAE
ncbi:MAG: ATP-dependent DNA ligase, partial [Pseudomonadota bacterium]|nr:ATP-dependent DNA ligase [Pseudomonadota bacterium]